MEFLFMSQHTQKKKVVKHYIKKAHALSTPYIVQSTDAEIDNFRPYDIT